MSDDADNPSADAPYPHVPPERRKHSGSETRQRSAVMGFRASSAERAEIEAAADRVGLTPGSYIRSRALAAPVTRATRRPPVDRAALAQLLGQLGKVGSNLNQIARSENRGQEAEWMGQALRHALADLGEMKTALMKALGRSDG